MQFVIPLKPGDSRLKRPQVSTGEYSQSLNLNKTTRHAVRVLIDRAQEDGELATTPEIALRLHLSPAHVVKVAGLLRQAGLLVSVRGRHGGLRLARPAEQIRIGDVVRSLSRSSTLTKQNQPEGLTGLNLMVAQAREAFITALDAYTIADVVSGQAPSRVNDWLGRKPRKRTSR